MFAWDNSQALLSNGIALPAVGQDGSVSILRCVTTYQVNRYGTPDQSYLDYETLATLAAITRRLKAATTQKYPRAKLADDGTRFGPGQPVVTPCHLSGRDHRRSIGRWNTTGWSRMPTRWPLRPSSSATPETRTDSTSLWAPYLVGGLRFVALLNQFRLLSAEASASAAAPNRIAT